MTTIIFDGKLLVTDSQITADSQILTQQQKLFRRLDSEGEPCIIAICGYSTISTYVLNNYLWDITKKNKIKELNELVADLPDKEAGIQIVMAYSNDASKLWHFCSGQLAAFRFSFTQYNSAHCAFGSGREIAIGALKAGKNAIEALDIVASLDIFTDTEIQYYNFPLRNLVIPQQFL